MAFAYNYHEPAQCMALDQVCQSRGVLGALSAGPCAKAQSVMNDVRSDLSQFDDCYSIHNGAFKRFTVCRMSAHVEQAC